MKKISQLEWIRKAQEVHGYTYDYSKVNYLNSRRKVTIICCEHGEFEQLANSHLQGKGCQKCWYKKNGIARNSNTEEFINKAIKVHGDKYDYSKVVYSKAMEKVLITCKTHGDFSQLPSHHLSNHGCPICGDTVRSNTDDFIKRAKEVHGSRYDYSFVNYVKNSSKIKIICSKHGVFEQSPSNHTNGKQGCPKCAKNKKTIYRGIYKATTLFLFLVNKTKSFVEAKDFNSLKFSKLAALICPFAKTPFS